MLCQREPSGHPADKGGWYHFYDEIKGVAAIGFKAPQAKAAPKGIDAAKMIREWRAITKTFQFQLLADELGVLVEAVVAIGAAWAQPHNAWAFPMRDGHGETIGIRLRNQKGQKWAVTGSRQGIFLPNPEVKVQQVAFVPEGPTNVMAGLSLGLFTIGRPNGAVGVDHLKVACKRLGIFRAAIVADNDPLKQLGTRFGHPGIEYAQKVKRELGLNSIIWQPTGDLKDMRDFLKAGGTRAMIEAQMKDRIWSRK